MTTEPNTAATGMGEELIGDVGGQAHSWIAVTKLLDEVLPEWRQLPGTGCEKALDAIRGLATTETNTAAPGMGDASLLREALEFTEYAAAALIGTHPLSEEYKAEFLEMGDPLQKKLIAALAAQPAPVVEPTDEAIEEFLSSRMTPEGRVPMIQTIKDALETFVCMDCRYNGRSLCDTHGTAQPAPVVGGVKPEMVQDVFDKLPAQLNAKGRREFFAERLNEALLAARPGGDALTALVGLRQAMVNYHGKGTVPKFFDPEMTAAFLVIDAAAHPAQAGGGRE